MSDKVSSIGGQALMEGVMMRGPSSMAMAVRDGDGIIEVESERLKPRKWYHKVPIIRGVAAFVSSLVTGVSTLMRSAKVLGGEDEELSNGAMTFAVVLGVFFAVALFMVLPEVLARLFDRFVYHNVLVKSLIAGVIRIAIFVVYLALVSKMKDIRRTFMYHGAEHRTINCYEKGMELTVENVQKCSTRHNRCGTTFLFIVMVVSILIFAVINWLLDIVFGDVLGGGIVESIVFIAVKLVFLPLVAGISYEVLKGVAKLPDNLFARILRAPGLALQGLTTAIPDDDMAEVAIKSFLTVMKLEADPNCPTAKFGEFELTEVRAYIRKKIPLNEEAEREWIICEALKASRGEVALRTTISADEFKRVKEIVRRRKEGEPLDYIVGSSFFYGYEVNVDENVLIPRMETEVLVSEAIKAIGDRQANVLDLCTGSGCIALVLAKKTGAVITASDISEDALKVAAKNLEGTEVALIKSDLFSEIDDKFDVIVSNPPYIASTVVDGLAPEVRRQPRLALDGGEDGLDFYKRIISSAPNFLTPGGYILLEIGYDQAESVRRLLYLYGFKDISIIKDLDGNDRVAIGNI